jgi:hypothetical protein
VEENNNRPPFQADYLLLLQQAGNLLKDAG